MMDCEKQYFNVHTTKYIHNFSYAKILSEKSNTPTLPKEIQDVPGGKVNILGGHSIGDSK